MTSLIDLANAIESTDRCVNDDGSITFPLKGVSYDLTYNNRLSLSKLSGADTGFTVVSPFGKWQDPPSKVVGGSSPLQKAFKNVLTEGIRLSKGQEKIFIDIIALEGVNPDMFFTESDSEDSPSVTRVIADTVNSMDESITPIIRFLLGTNESLGTSYWQEKLPHYHNIFWIKGKHGQAEPLIKHRLAELYVGYYSPNYKPPSSVIQKVKDMIALLIGIQSLGKGLISLITGSSDRSPSDVGRLADDLFKRLAVSMSWNHGKVLAVDGMTMMTGGMNYWPEYSAAQHEIIDMQATVVGDAAISAHKYANYFWSYLNATHDADTRSFKKSISLTATGALDGQWGTEFVPLFDRKPSEDKSGIPVLSISRLGDWRGPSSSIKYPIQAVDALRDVLLNSTIHVDSKTNNFKDMIKMIEGFSDTSTFFEQIGKLGVSPAAWASRFARVYAISNAEECVHISNQMIVNCLQMASEDFKEFRDSINGVKGKDEPEWDGLLWPYDLLLAFAKVLLKFQASKSEGNGIFVVLTTHEPDEKHATWDDPIPVQRIKARIKPLIRGLDESLSDDDATNLLKEKFQVRRVENIHGAQYLHTKTICVDRKLLYVGSDNLYPSYNEEHGIWVEDGPTIDAWFTGFWDGLWMRAVPKEEEVDYEKERNENRSDEEIKMD